MSLFPAYTSDKETSDVKQEEKEVVKEPGSWLQNSSFTPALPAPVVTETVTLSSDEEITCVATSRCAEQTRGVTSSDEERRSHKHKKHKRKHKKEKKSSRELMENNYGKRKKSSSHEMEADSGFYIDKKKETDFYGMLRLTGPNVPRFSRRHFRALGRTWRQHKAKLRRRRYYNPKHDKTEREGEEGERPAWQHDVQTELKNTTEALNRTLSKEPNNISAWLKLCRLQPSLLSLTPRNGPGMLSPAERRSVTEKQIAILDKALHHNPTCGELIKERYGLASTVVPGDALAAELRTRLSLEPCLLAGWLELARVERSHLASCSVPQVTNVYAEAMQAVNSRRKKEPMLHIETSILELALGCGMFLQESGLQEQVWTLLRLYTETYLPPCRDPVGIAELQATANHRAAALEEEAATKEDELLSSGLPNFELWLRIERLRETAHFLPSPDCTWAREGDPQRLVYPEDLAHLSQPIMSPRLSLRVAVTALIVLGVPPLPFTHSVARGISPHTSLPHLGLLATAWPMLAPDIANHAGWLGDEALYFSSTSGSGPLTPGPGGQLYRSLLHTAFHRYAACLENRERTVLLCWWLRLETLYARLSPESVCVAHVRSGAKRLLKQTDNRTETQMFREFAMLEAALSHSTAAAEKILVPSIQAAGGKGPLKGRADRTSICCAFRSLAEIWAYQGHGSKVTALLCGLVLEDRDPLTSESPDKQVIDLAISRFELVIREAISEQQGDAEVDLLELLSEHFVDNVVACYAWLLLSTQTIWSTGAMLEQTLQHLGTCLPNSRASLHKEKIYEVYVSVVEFHNRSHPGGTSLLRQILSRGLAEFPNNSSLLATQSNLTVSLSQDVQIDISYQLLGNIVRVLALEHRIQLHERAEREACDVELVQRCNPKIIAQYERLISHFESRHCPLVWRLYLRYVGLRATPENIRVVFYKALEDCPWVKALYLQGASLLPEELGNIQDLLVEKQLRLHVAPEELEILRND